MVSGRIAYAQILCAAIKTVKGELQLNINEGIPFFETIFQNSRYLYLWEAKVKSRILSFDFVLSINSFVTDIDYKNHVLYYKTVISTDEGNVEISDINFNIITGGSGGGSSGGGDMSDLIQNGIFYLPVFIADGVQVYRTLTQYVSEEMGTVTTELSETTYIKVDGTFVERT